MLDILPPLWMRGPIFAMREFMTNSVTSVFFAIRIDEAVRYFHSYCDLSDPNAVDAMRAAIVNRESRPVRAMSREERLEHIWSATAVEYCGLPAPAGRSQCTASAQSFSTAARNAAS
jgi:hypothetical protein